MRAKCFLSILMIVAMVITLLPARAAVAFSIIQDIEERPITILDDGSYYIIQGSSTPTSNSIRVAAGASPNITLDGVNIDSSGCAFLIEDSSTGNVHINLVGENTLKSTEYYAGLQKNGFGVGIGTLTIEGTGSLTATGGHCSAGIGGSDGFHGSNITINGGTIIASGGRYGAGIGGGYGGDSGGSGSNITINGGMVIATGGDCSAGIGGGDYGFGSNITINGGEVTATGGYYSGAGIGGGYNGSGGNITINDGEVTATGGDYSAGIGGGDGDSGSNIIISGGTVTAMGGIQAAGIGGGWNGSGSNITINGGTVTADGGYGIAGIGAGYEGASASNIKISPAEGKQITVMAGDTKPPETLMGSYTVATSYTHSDRYFYSYEQDFTALEAALKDAAFNKGGIIVSTDGKDIDKDKQWVSQAVMDEYSLAIATAQAVADNSVATQAEIYAVVDDLENATATFNTAKAYGIMAELSGPVTPMKASDIAKLILSAAEVQKNHTIGNGKDSRKINFISEVARHMGPGTDFEWDSVPVPKDIWVGAEGAQVETMNPDYWAAVLCYLNKLIDDNSWLGLDHFSYSYDDYVDDLKIF